MTENRFLKNTAWILSGQITRLVISFIISVLTARFLGPSNIGILDYVNSYLSFFVSVVGLGLNGVIVYELVNNRDKEGKFLGTAIFLRFIAAVISFALMMAIILFTDGDDKTVVAVAFLQALQLPFLCFDTIDFWYQSNMKSKYAVIAQITAYFGMALYKTVLLIAKKSVLWFAFAVPLDTIIVAAIYIVFYKKHRKRPLSVSCESAKVILKSCFPFVLANLMIVIYGHMDRIMIKQLLDDNAQVGYYSVALTICGLMSFVPVALLDSSRPLIVKAKGENDEKYKKQFKMLVSAIVWISIIYSAFVTVFAKPILNLLYGDAFLNATDCLRIAVWFTAFSYLGSAKDLWLVCEKKKRFVMVFCLIGVVSNLIMNVVFIPIWGINGAALATLLTQIIINFASPALFGVTRYYSKCVLGSFTLRNLNLKFYLSLIKQKFKR